MESGEDGRDVQRGVCMERGVHGGDGEGGY